MVKRAPLAHEQRAPYVTSVEVPLSSGCLVAHGLDLGSGIHVH